MRVLLAEDEQKAAAALSKGLKEGGYAVDVADNGEDALHLARTVDYALVILDVMMPVHDGWHVVETMRRAQLHTPVLFLTARDEIADRVRGLNLGADDYMVKPFAFAELLARVRSLLRRGAQCRPSVMEIGDLRIDTIRHRATRADQVLDLTPKEFMLLMVLARRAGEVVSRTHICEQLWDINFESFTNVVDVHVRRLRCKLDDPFPVKLLRTVRGTGYMLEGASESA